LLSIAIYSNNEEEVTQLKSIIQDFLIEMHIIAKVSCFNDPEAIVMVPNRYDIYIMDIDADGNIF
jgi:hypothetical protein